MGPERNSCAGASKGTHFIHQNMTPPRVGLLRGKPHFEIYYGLFFVAAGFAAMPVPGYNALQYK